MDLNLSLDNFCWCCLEVTNNLLCMRNEEFQNHGANIKIIDGFYEQSGIQNYKIIPIDNPKICTLCIVSLKISCTFHTMCVNSAQKLMEFCRAKQEQQQCNDPSTSIKIKPEIFSDDETPVTGETSSIQPVLDVVNAPTDTTLNKKKEGHRCHICDKVYRYRSVLSRHLEAHERYKCTKCTAVYFRLRLLEDHIKEIHPEETTSFEPLQMLELLYDSDDEKPPGDGNSMPKSTVKVEVQEDAASDSSTITAEEMTNLNVQCLSKRSSTIGKPQITNRRIHRCPICRKTYNFQSVLERHIASHARHKCLHCERTFLRLNQLTAHIVYEHGSEAKHEYRCEFCDKMYRFDSVLQRHIMQNHKFNDSNSSSKRHSCPFLCGKSFNFQSVLRRHITQHEKYKCPHCGQGFTRSTTLDAHITDDHPDCTRPVAFDKPMTHSIKKEHSCYLCGKIFQFQSVLQKHIACHEKYKCDHCEMGFTRLTVLEDHLQDVHQIMRPLVNITPAAMRKDHQCHLCEKAFHFQSVLVRHIARHEKYKCNVCGQGFARLAYLEEHLAEDHQDDGNESNTSSNRTKGEHACKLCGKVFSFRSRLLKHLNDHNKYKCSLPHCTMGFTRLKYLDEHMLEIHQIDNSTSSLDEIKLKTEHTCPLCGKTFVFQSQLVRHIAAHNRYKCLHCDLGFTKANLLDRHVAQKHTEFSRSFNEASLSCEFCGKNFEFRSALKIHLMAHKHKCTYCDKLFTRVAYIDDHIREDHPAEWAAQPVEVSNENRCLHCDKVFEYPSVLKTHLAQHKHKCTFCEKIFTRLPLVDAHIKEEHPTQWTCPPVVMIVENRCDQCNKVFDYPSVLKLHMTSHKYKCSYCMKKFTRTVHVDEHTKVEHPEKWVEPDVTKDETTTTHSCHLCEKVFEFPSALKIHLAAHKYNCLHCDRNYTKLLSLNEHVKEQHPDEWAKIAELDVKPENRCDLCDKVFEFPSTLKTHIAWHNRYKCRDCAAIFPRLTLLEDHIKTDHPQTVDPEVKPENRCHLCNKVFGFPSVLKAHIAQHYSHKCEHCEQGFTKWDLLQDHISTDHSEKNEPIEDNVGFGGTALLEQHISEAHIKEEVQGDEELTIEHQTIEPRTSKRKRFKRRLSIDLE